MRAWARALFVQRAIRGNGEKERTSYDFHYNFITPGPRTLSGKRLMVVGCGEGVGWGGGGGGVKGGGWWWWWWEGGLKVL